MHERYVNIFNDLGADWEAIVNERDTSRETDFIEKVLSELSKKGIVLDLCCGTARHSIILHKRGWNMIGLDLSKNLLAIANRNMKKKKAELPIVRADMRHFPFKENVFNAVISMFTSFGYLPSESEDMKGFNEIRRTLRRKGKFLLDVANRDHIIQVFQEKEWAEFKHFYMLEKRTLDLQASRLISQWTIIKKGKGKNTTLEHNVRLYTLQNLKKMLKKAELTITKVYGGYNKKEFNPNSTRIIIITEKTT